MQSLECGPRNLVATCQYNDIGSAEALRGFAQETAWQNVTMPEGASGVDDDNVQSPRQPAMLKSIVEHENIRAESFDGFFTRSRSIGIRKANDARASSSDEPFFIVGLYGSALVAARQDRRIPAHLFQSLHKVDDQRRFSGSTGGQVSHTEDRYRECHRRVVPIVPAITQDHRGGISVSDAAEHTAHR